MNDSVKPERIALPPPTRDEAEFLSHFAGPQELRKLPKECRDLIIAHLDTFDICNARQVSKFWQTALDSDPRYWRHLECDDRLSWSFIYRALAYAKGSIATVKLTADAILKEDSPVFDKLLTDNRMSIKSINIDQVDMTGDILHQHIPYMTNLVSLRLPCANAILLESTSLRQMQTWRVNWWSPNRMRALSVPQSLRDLEIASLSYPLGGSGWPVASSLVRLTVGHLSTIRPMAGLRLDHLAPLARTLRHLRLTGLTVNDMPAGNSSGSLTTFTALEELHIDFCFSVVKFRLPQSLRSLSINKGNLARKSEFLSSPLSSLEQFSLRGREDLITGRVLTAPLLTTSRSLTSLKIVWKCDAGIRHVQGGPFPRVELTSLLIQHGPTLKGLVLDYRQLPAGIVWTIIDQCEGLITLGIRSERIGWRALGSMVHRIRRDEWGLRKLRIIHWDQDYDAAEQAHIRTELDSLSIDHIVLTKGD